MDAPNRLPLFDANARTIGVVGSLDSRLCFTVAEMILRLHNASSRKPVRVYLACAGGESDDVFMLLDCLGVLGKGLHTYALSRVFGLGILLFAAGSKRFALPYARFSREGLAGASKVGFTGTQIPTSIEVRISDYLMHRLGKNCSEKLVHVLSEEIDSKKAVEIGLVHNIVGAPKRLSVLAPARHRIKT